MVNNSEILVRRIDSAIEFIAGIATSNATMVLLGTLISAFAGAYGAQYMARKHKERDEKLKEFRNTNAATIIAFEICNSAISIKGQYVAKMKEEYDNDKLEINKLYMREKFGLGNPRNPFVFTANLQTFPNLTIDGWGLYT